MRAFTGKTIVMMISLAALLVPATAAAQGNAGGDQYTENVPTADGQTPSADIDPSGEGGDGGDGSESVAPTTAAPTETGTLSEDTTAGLGKKGADGDAVARLSEAAAPKHDSAHEADSSHKLAADDDRRTSQTAASSSGPGGLGIGLPVFLVLSLLAAVAVRYFRRDETS